MFIHPHSDAPPSALQRLPIATGLAFSILLDHIRWISALLVLLGHARNRMFAPYTAVEHMGLFGKVFFALTNIQNVAVICFFVISGVLIGGKLLEQLSESHASVKSFIIDRLVRLYVVLIPALALTLASTAIGVCSIGDPSLWLGNLLFLQHVIVPVPACNEPLWSLSNEFWYYVLGLLAVLSIKRNFVALLLLLAAIGLLLTEAISDHNILMYLPIWATGMLVYLPWRLRIHPAIPFGFFIAAVLLTRSHALDDAFWVRDTISALCLGLVLWAVSSQIKDPARTLPLAKLGKVMASFSFSLYLVHWPIIHIVIKLAERQGTAFPLNPQSPTAKIWFTGTTLFCLLTAYLFACVTEAQTAKVRQFLYKRISTNR